MRPPWRPRRQRLSVGPPECDRYHFVCDRLDLLDDQVEILLGAIRLADGVHRKGLAHETETSSWVKPRRMLCRALCDEVTSNLRTRLASAMNRAEISRRAKFIPTH